MKQFVYTIRSPLVNPVHSANSIAKIAKKFADTLIMISCNGMHAKATAWIKLIGLKIRHGSCVSIVAEGEDEDAAIIALSDFFQNSL